jgi:eukaryotic-like serine/threonine-protein kinase
MLGSQLGHYRIAERLGAGGMGDVYRAHDTRLGRDVALKVLRPDVAADGERRERFLREARLLAALDHPGIVTVHSVEEVDGVHFLTMQLVDGETLDELIPATGLPFERCFELAVPLSEAVAAAHARGIVHRDLKPSNVMRARDGRIKILDFGLAKLCEAPLTSADAQAPTDLHTREGVMLGTLPYMAPEQIEGREADARSDVFALGVLFYEMVTGRRPFTGRTPAALLSAILQTQPLESAELRRGVPRPLSRLLRRCLEKDPARRPVSAVAVREELMEVGSSVQRTLSASNGGSAASPTPASSIAVLPFASLSADKDDEFFADGVAEEIINALGRLPALRVAARTSTFAFKGTQEDLRVIGDKLGVGSVLEGSVRRAGRRLRIVAQLVDVVSGYQLWSERYDRELDDVFQIQEEIARSIASRLQATLAGGTRELVEQGTRDVDAFELHARGRSLCTQRTEEAMRRSIDCFRNATERDPAYAPAWAGLAASLVLLVDYYGHTEPEPQAQISRAQRAVEHALALAPDLAEAHCALNMLHYRRRDGPGALREIDRAVELRPSYAEAHNWRCWVGLLVGRLDTALAGAQHAVELDPLSPEARNHLALAQLAAGASHQALREMQASIQLQPDFTTSILYEALVRFHAGDVVRCRQLLDGLSLPWAGSAPQTLLAIAGTAHGDVEPARRMADRLTVNGEPDLAGLLFAALDALDDAFAAFERAERWGYWPTLAVRWYFPAELAALRADPRYRHVIATIDRQWGMAGSPTE